MMLKATVPFDAETVSTKTYPDIPTGQVFQTGYDRLKFWFTIPEYNELRDAMQATMPTMRGGWSPEYQQAYHAVVTWENHRKGISTC